MISVGDEGQNVYQAHNYWDFSAEQQPHRTVDKWNMSSVMNIDGGVFRTRGHSVFSCGEVWFEFAGRDPKQTQIPADILLQSTGLAATSAVDELRKSWAVYACAQHNLTLRFSECF